MITEEYFQVKGQLEKIADEHYPILDEINTSLNEINCLTRNKTRILLLCQKEFSTYLADYVGKLRELAKSPKIMAKLIQEPEVEIILTKKCLQTIGYPRNVVLRLTNSFFENKIPVTKHLDRVDELLTYFWYLGSTYSWSSSLLSTIWGAKTLFDDEKSDNHLLEANCKIITDQVHDEVLRGLLHISNRAKFLSETDDENVESGDIDWWCDKIDSEHYEHKLKYLLEKCPNPHDVKVKARIKELMRTRSGFSPEMLKNISFFMKNGG